MAIGITKREREGKKGRTGRRGRTKADTRQGLENRCWGKNSPKVKGGGEEQRKTVGRDWPMKKLLSSNLVSFDYL